MFFEATIVSTMVSTVGFATSRAWCGTRRATYSSMLASFCSPLAQILLQNSAAILAMRPWSVTGSGSGLSPDGFGLRPWSFERVDGSVSLSFSARPRRLSLRRLVAMGRGVFGVRSGGDGAFGALLLVSNHSMYLLSLLVSKRPSWSTITNLESLGWQCVT